MTRQKKQLDDGIATDVTDTTDTVVSDASFEVKDPEILRPKDLPFVITPKSGGWNNPEQAKFAAVLNAYAYKNPGKWQEKKDMLLAQLTRIGENPSALGEISGRDTRLEFKNQLVPNITE